MNLLNLILITLNVATIKQISAVPQEAFCCPPGQALLKRNTECWNPLDNKTSPIIQLTCNSTVIIQDSLINFTLLESGHLVTHVEDEYTLYTDPIPVGTFCVANETNRRDVNIRNATRVMVLCTDEEQDIIDDDILAYCMIVSVIFLCLTALIYALISELRDLHGKSIINLCISLAIGLMILVTIKIVPYQDMKLCAVRGFLTYFFIITGFLWMNCISIQILLSIRRPTVSSYGWKEFGIYALYAWGCPAILTVSMAIVNYYPGKHHRPGIGLNSCWFFTQTQQWYYMYSVITIILVANICMFIYTSFVLWSQSFKSSTHVKALKYKFTMTLRLCIIMGLPWIFEMITASSKAHLVWVILDIFNTLQGVFIFIVLVILRPRVIKAMHRRGLLCCLSRLFEKHLAVDDDEENIVQHTIIVPMEERA